MSRKPAELDWVFRPNLSAPHTTGHAAHAGKRVRSVGQVGDDGLAEVVLHDGVRVRATPTEVVTG